MPLYAALLFSWAIHIKYLFISKARIITWINIPWVLCNCFIGINIFAAQFAVTHELMHKPNKFYRVLATLHMVKLNYAHFTYHHLYKHHHDVATLSDPSTSRKGENVYQFIKRCIVDSWIGVYND